MKTLQKYRKPLSPIGIWDYDMSTIDLRDESVLTWYLERKILFHDYVAIDKEALKRVWKKLRLPDHWKQTLQLCFGKS